MAYKVLISERALNDIHEIVVYLLHAWSKKEAIIFLDKLEKRKCLLANNPDLFPFQPKEQPIHKAVLTKHNIIYYSINESEKTVQIITIFNVFQDPKKLPI